MVASLYNVRVELRGRDLRGTAENIMDKLADYSPAIGTSRRGWTEVTITVPATDLGQAFTTATAVVARATLLEQLVVEVMPTAEFDARRGLEPWPELVSVAEAAAELKVSRQAIMQRIASGSLPATRIGNAWVIQRAALRRGRRPHLE